MADTSRAIPHHSRIASDGLDAALAIYLVVYSIAAACFALGLYALLQPSKSTNPGTAAYNPPPGTVISYTPARSLASPETDGRAAVAAELAPTIGLADQAPKDAAKLDAPVTTDNAKNEVKPESKPRHSAHARDRRRPEWGYQPSFFGQHRPWF